MSEKISLKKIIESVLEEKGEEVDEPNNQVRLRRAFSSLLERLGGDKNVIKGGGKNMEFDEFEAPIIKALLLQLHSGNGIIAEFANSRHRNKGFSSDEVIRFIHSLCDEMDKDDKMNKEEITYLCNFFRNIFLYSPLRSLETCHKMIDTLASNLYDFSCDEQSIYLGKVEHILKKEVALRIAESAIEVVRIGERKKAQEEYYYEKNPEIQFFYAQRDMCILKAIQEDDELRQYIEKKLGGKAETIFNYASLV